MDIQKIKALYKAGKSTTIIAQKIGISRGHLSRYLARYDWFKFHKGQKKVSHNQEKHLVRKYINGEPVNTILSYAGISRTLLYRILGKHKVELKSKKV